MVNIPRVVIAAPASGHGKTSVATGLLAAFAQRGLTVSPHKVGPDYIDPAYHGLAAGRPGRNLDPWLVGEERIVPLFLHGAATPSPADIAIVEGVMGLFDGVEHAHRDGVEHAHRDGVEHGHRDGVVNGHSDRVTGREGFASTAHVAGLLKAPVILVVDASAQGRSIAALLHGFASFDPSTRISGVILNRVGSARHEQLLRDAVVAIGLPVLGAIYRRDALATPSRHLGLIPAAERSTEARATVDALAAAMRDSLDLDGIAAIAQAAPPLTGPAWDATLEVRDPIRITAPRIALAGGRAFSFSYAETSELLTAAGADVVTFDPMTDDRLPADTRAVVIGGGFPEMYTAKLTDNRRLRAELAAFARADGPIVAECAGLLYLSLALDGVPMCGVLDVDAQMTSKLTLGYREAVAVTDSIVAPTGTRVRGHEFHRTATVPAAGPTPAWQWSPDAPEGFVQGKVHASYLHLHWAGSPQIAKRIVASCV